MSLKPLPTPTASDLQRLERYDTSVRVRGLIEMAVARRVITDLLQSGHSLRVDDGEELHPWVHPNPNPSAQADEADVENLLGQCFAVEDCRVMTMSPRREKGWVRFVMGNTGWDLVCDSTVNLEEALAGSTEFANELCEWC